MAIGHPHVDEYCLGDKCIGNVIIYLSNIGSTYDLVAVTVKLPLHFDKYISKENDHDNNENVSFSA